MDTRLLDLVPRLLPCSLSHVYYADTRLSPILQGMQSKAERPHSPSLPPLVNAAVHSQGGHETDPHINPRVDLRPSSEATFLMHTSSFSPLSCSELESSSPSHPMFAHAASLQESLPTNPSADTTLFQHGPMGSSRGLLQPEYAFQPASVCSSGSLLQPEYPGVYPSIPIPGATDAGQPPAHERIGGHPRLSSSSVFESAGSGKRQHSWSGTEPRGVFGPAAFRQVEGDCQLPASEGKSGVRTKPQADDSPEQALHDVPVAVNYLDGCDRAAGKSATLVDGLTETGESFHGGVSLPLGCNLTSASLTADAAASDSNNDGAAFSAAVSCGGVNCSRGNDHRTVASTTATSSTEKQCCQCASACLCNKLQTSCLAPMQGLTRRPQHPVQSPSCSQELLSALNSADLVYLLATKPVQREANLLGPDALQAASNSRPVGSGRQSLANSVNEVARSSAQDEHLMSAMGEEDLVLHCSDSDSDAASLVDLTLRHGCGRADYDCEGATRVLSAGASQVVYPAIDRSCSEGVAASTCCTQQQDGALPVQNMHLSCDSLYDDNDWEW